MGGVRQQFMVRATAVLVAACLAALVPPVAAGATPPPRVAIIVGPAGAAVTERYRQAAEAAATIAETLTTDVVRVYSPNATWPAVKAAVTGASVVVYLGHGNGWPSRYSDALMPRTQDGFGLNPVAGVDDVAHQYYGEASVGRLRLAHGAVVLLSHLCYASGNSEPGLPAGTFDEALSRADGFAAGFLAAGATTVVAEGHTDPAALIAAAIGGNAAVGRAWSGATWGHGNMATYASVRTPGAAITLDPDTRNADAQGAGYYRSMVRVAATGNGPRVPEPVPVVPTGPPSLIATGARFGPAAVAGSVLPGHNTSLRVPVTRSAAKLPASLSVGLRWLPLVDTGPGAGGSAADGGLVVGEAAADVVETADARFASGALSVKAQVPTEPGTYVVLLTLETGDGVPYDVATQALLRPFTVVVPKPIDVAISAPATINAQAGAAARLTVGLANTGTQAWGSSFMASLWADPAPEPWLAQYLDSVLVLTATWIDPATGAAVPAAAYSLPRDLGAPGHATTLDLAVRAPDLPGHYILVLTVAARGGLGEFPDESLVVPAVVR